MIYIIAALIVLTIALTMALLSQAKDLDTLWRKVSQLEHGQTKTIYHHYPKAERPRGLGAEAIIPKTPDYGAWG